MISQLLATIIMALGVASGTKATSNTFYDAEKPQIKKANTQETITTNFTKMQTYSVGNKWYEKYYITDANTTNPNPTYVMPNMMLTNTEYAISEPLQGTNYYITKVYYIYKLINIYAGQTSFDVSATILIATNTTHPEQIYSYENFVSTDTNTDDLIDITLTAGTASNLENSINALNKTRIYDYQDQTNSTSNLTLNNAARNITLMEDETVYLIMITTHLYRPNDSNSTTNVRMEDQIIDVDYIQPTQTYEVVDIPGLMYTVLTMPFSFISTAFNLTVFPNTPYALNFSNLFMVLLATFILLWIIKKVFH